MSSPPRLVLPHRLPDPMSILSWYQVYKTLTCISGRLTAAWSTLDSKDCSFATGVRQACLCLSELRWTICQCMLLGWLVGSDLGSCFAEAFATDTVWIDIKKLNQGRSWPELFSHPHPHPHLTPLVFKKTCTLMVCDALLFRSSPRLGEVLYENQFSLHFDPQLLGF